MSFLQTFFGTVPAKKQASAIDVTTYLASLASDSRAVDPLLDPMRELTSQLKSDHTLTPTQQNRLADVCLSLEDYLIKSDPLRHFNRALLQRKIMQKFPRPKPNEGVFWAKLSN